MSKKEKDKVKPMSKKDLSRKIKKADMLEQFEKKHGVIKEAAEDVLLGFVNKHKLNKEVKKRRTLTPPPKPIAKIGDLVNPLIDQPSGLKYGFAMAIYEACKFDLPKTAQVILVSGICYKNGWTSKSLTEPTGKSDWNGTGYNKILSENPGFKDYLEKHPAKIEKCRAFAKALVKQTLG